MLELLVKRTNQYPFITLVSTHLAALCGGILTATDMPQNISSPNYPSPSSQAVRCRWTIDSGAPNKQVSLTLLDIDLTPDAQCTQDYMEFRDSPMVSFTRNSCCLLIPNVIDYTCLNEEV